MRDYFDRELTRYLDSIFDGTPAEPDPDFQREQMLELRDEVRRASPTFLSAAKPRTVSLGPSPIRVVISPRSRSTSMTSSGMGCLRKSFSREMS